MRCFIAINLDLSVKANIRDFIQNKVSQNFKGIRWVKPENLHITLAFLGEITTEQASSIKKVLESILAKHESFPIELSGIGFFPNRKNPKVFWIGIKEQPKLLKLKHDIDKCLTECNIYFDKKPFSPHLTIGRIKSPLKIESEIVEALDFKASFLVTEFFLIKSDLFSDGPVYSDLYRFEFGKFLI
ncbi:MAG: RNA 2',3'-cyclic phosphodiesterase [Thermoanaerobacteraceae bacterium]|nr:RNA 2',3'-cyclic phosphodiesterase [Thermoanaerobacteraceae bacterium]